MGDFPIYMRALFRVLSALRRPQAPLVQGPAQTRPDAPAALLVLMPGAMLGPKDYESLLAAIKAHSDASVDLWVAVPTINWPYIISLGFTRTDQWTVYSDDLINEAVAAAVAAGFPLLGKVQARMENVFVAMHSIAGAFYPGVPLKHTGGTILLGSVVDGNVCAAMPDAPFAAPYPMMHILGALDGQLRLPRAAWVAAHVAPLAAQVWPRHFARTRPFAVVPGLNHAQFSNGVVNTARGDTISDVPLDTQSEVLAGLLAAFVAANHPDATEESSMHEVEQLLQATTASFDLLTPFLEASGRGCPSALLATGWQLPAQGAEVVEARSFGAERLGPFAPNRNSHAHVGELAVAERFARDAQHAMLAAGLPGGGAELDGSVRIAVTSHTDLDTFTYSQPIIFQMETPAGKQWVVQAHVYLHWEYYQPGQESMLKPLSPYYLLKLKKGAALAMAMGLEGGTDGVLTGAQLNEGTLKAALKTAPALFQETYAKGGKQLSFAPDNDVTEEISSPVDWIKMPLNFEPGKESSSLVLTSPSFGTPAALPPRGFDHGPGRFAGNHYVKALSPAWMHEWVMIEALRR